MFDEWSESTDERERFDKFIKEKYLGQFNNINHDAARYHLDLQWRLYRLERALAELKEEE